LVFATGVASPTQYHLMGAYDKARAPLDAAADEVWQFFRDLREAETPPINPWKSVREGLRENPDGAVLRHSGRICASLHSRR
jgi:hypothetical protein